MTTSTTDRIEKRATLRAPLARIWRALTDAQEFGTWFRVRLEGQFAEGRTIRGHITYPGYEHIRFESQVVRIEPQRYFAFRWHPYAIDSAVDYSSEPTTLVEFRLEADGDGTMLTVTESGFDQIPLARRAEAFRMNDGGWSEQMKNIAAHVSPS